MRELREHPFERPELLKLEAARLAFRQMVVYQQPIGQRHLVVKISREQLRNVVQFS